MNVIKLLFIITITFPLFLTAEEIVLDLTYNPPLDPYYCDKNPNFCKKLETSKVPTFDMTPTATKGQWAVFWTFQVLDAYSTSRALKYDCVKEINPIYTEYPSDSRIIATKTLLLAPALLYNDAYRKITPEELDSTNMLYMFVVANNFRLLNRAKDTCNKR